MEYAARLPKAPSRKNLVAPLVALLVGAGVATGAYALIDDGNSTTSPAKVIVVEQPAEGSAAIPGKNEAATAAALSGTSGIVPRGSKASATGSVASDPHGPAIELRGSKASATAGHPSSGGVSAAEELRADPHGTAISLRNP